MTTKSYTIQVPIERRKIPVADYSPAAIAESIRSGYGCTTSDLEEQTLPGGTKVTVHAPSGLWVSDSFFGNTRSYEVWADDKQSYVKTVHVVPGGTRNMLYSDDQRRARVNAENAEVDKLFAKILAKTKTAPVGYQRRSDTLTRSEVTLDSLDALVAKTHAELSVVRGSAVLVEAVDTLALEAAVNDASATMSQMARIRIKAAAHSIRLAVLNLVEVVDRLDSLAVEYVKTGQRPKAEVGRGKANRLGDGGVWVN